MRVKRAFRCCKHVSGYDCSRVDAALGSNSAIRINNNGNAVGRSQPEGHTVFHSPEHRVRSMKGRKLSIVIEIIICGHQHNLRTGTHQFAGDPKTMPVPTNTDSDLAMQCVKYFKIVRPRHKAIADHTTGIANTFNAPGNLR